MEPLIGRTLGQYQIVEDIGRGGMATVYRASQPTLHRFVAIKVLPPVLSMDEQFLARFRREAMVVANLAHPNILPVYDFGNFDGYVAIVMMYVAGGTLRQKMLQPIDFRLANRIATQIAEGLDYAHRRGVIHRDIKPNNILMAQHDWAVLSDFGIAHLANRETLSNSGVGIGTAEYMSPEQALGDPVDARTDIYSLGVVLYELLCGRVPFHGQSPIATLHQHIYEPLPALTLQPGVPALYQMIVAKALAKSPADRFQTASELRTALEAAAHPSVMFSVADTLPPRSRQPKPEPPSTTITPAPARNTPVKPVKTADPMTLVSRPAVAVPRKRRRIWPLFVLLLAGMVLLAAVGLGSVMILPEIVARLELAPAATVTAVRPTPTAVPSGGVLFSDDFADPRRNEWFNSDSQATFQGGKLIIASIQDGRSFRTWPETQPNRQDLIVEADLSKVSGPENYGYGIFVRDTGTGDLLFFSVRGAGSFRLERLTNTGGEPEWSDVIPSTPSEAVKPGDAAVNRLRLAAIGPKLTLWVNGQQVAETNDVHPVSGRYGIMVGATGIVINCSQFTVIKP